MRPRLNLWHWKAKSTGPLPANANIGYLQGTRTINQWTWQTILIPSGRIHTANSRRLWIRATQHPGQVWYQIAGFSAGAVIVIHVEYRLLTAVVWPNMPCFMLSCSFIYLWTACVSVCRDYNLRACVNVVAHQEWVVFMSSRSWMESSIWCRRNRLMESSGPLARAADKTLTGTWPSGQDQPKDNSNHPSPGWLVSNRHRDWLFPILCFSARYPESWIQPSFRFGEDGLYQRNVLHIVRITPHAWCAWQSLRDTWCGIECNRASLIERVRVVVFGG